MPLLTWIARACTRPFEAQYQMAESTKRCKAMLRGHSDVLEYVPSRFNSPS